jgi:hypothetical protein
LIQDQPSGLANLKTPIQRTAIKEAPPRENFKNRWLSGIFVLPLSVLGLLIVTEKNHPAPGNVME